jgi:hypothetical protein
MDDITDDITPITDRFIRIATPGGSPVIDLRPATLEEIAEEDEHWPEEPLVRLTLPFENRELGEFRPEALRAALDEVEKLR